MTWIRRLVCITWVCVIAAPAHASDPGSPYEVDYALDLPITLGLFVAAGTPRILIDETIAVPCGGMCDRNNLNGLDRPVADNFNQGVATASDVMFYSHLALPYLLTAIDVGINDPVDGWDGYATDTMIYFETTAVVLSINNLLSFIVRRPRPTAYNPNAPEERRTGPDAALSFPSGHASGSFAVATAYSWTFSQRHPDSPMVIPVWISTYALAGATAYMRTEAGAHFWSDVLVGAALGMAVGWVVPYLHRRDDLGDARVERGGLNVQVLPALTSDGFGATLTIR